MDPTSSSEYPEPQSQNNSLAGKELPIDWPRILTTKEEGQEYRVLYDQNEDRNIEPPPIRQIKRLSFELANGDKKLTFFAVNHSTDPQDPQFHIIEQQFKNSNPEIVLTESEWTIPPEIIQKKSRDQAIAKWGEVGFMNWLVSQHNQEVKEDEAIEIEGCDIPFTDWVNEFRKLGYTNEQIFVLNIVRNVYYHSGLARDQQQDLNQAELELIVNFRKNYESPSQDPFFGQVLSLLPRADGQNWTWELFKQQYQKEVGKAFVFEQVNSATDLPKMFADERNFRDHYVINEIVSALKLYDRIMILMGSGHAIREKPALEQFFDSEAQSIKTI